VASTPCNAVLLLEGSCSIGTEPPPMRTVHTVPAAPRPLSKDRDAEVASSRVVALVTKHRYAALVYFLRANRRASWNLILHK
jgi:hypothetical protein